MQIVQHHFLFFIIFFFFWGEKVFITDSFGSTALLPKTSRNLEIFLSCYILRDAALVK